MNVINRGHHINAINIDPKKRMRRLTVWFFHRWRPVGQQPGLLAGSEADDWNPRWRGSPKTTHPQASRWSMVDLVPIFWPKITNKELYYIHIIIIMCVYIYIFMCVYIYIYTKLYRNSSCYILLDLDGKHGLNMFLSPQSTGFGPNFDPMAGPDGCVHRKITMFHG